MEDRADPFAIEDRGVAGIADVDTEGFRGLLHLIAHHSDARRALQLPWGKGEHTCAAPIVLRCQCTAISGGPAHSHRNRDGAGEAHDKMSVACAAVAFGDLHIVDRQRGRRQRIQRRSKGEAKHQVVEIPMPASVGFLPGQGLAVLLGQEMAEAIAVGGGIREEHRLLCALPLQHIGTGAVVH